MEHYILMTCLECNHSFKSNLNTKYPRCSRCRSSNVIESKQVKNSELKNEIESLKKYVFQTAQTQDEIIKQLNLLIDEYEQLKKIVHTPSTKNKSGTYDDTHNPGKTKPKKSIAEMLDAMG